MFQKGEVGRTNRPTYPISQNSPIFLNCTYLVETEIDLIQDGGPMKRKKEPRSPRSRTPYGTFDTSFDPPNFSLYTPFKKVLCVTVTSYSLC